ncbi:MAG TPA: hypothetical protein V6D08_17785 [Candidatus Obscuribacterales bacterium]
MTIGRVLPVLLSLLVAGQVIPAAQAKDSDINFKIYSPETAPVGNQPAAGDQAGAASQPDQTNQPDEALDAPAAAQADEKPDASSPEKAAAPESTTADRATAAGQTPADKQTGADTPAGAVADGEKIASKVLQGYIRVVPSGTKIPIIMDTAIDSDTSQEGDEFSARTAEDLTIDGSTLVPAGSIIKGRIAQLNAPRHLNRSGSVALKFDTVTTPDNRQIPIVANLVARGGVVHARRGMKDIAMDTGIVAVPAAAGLGIGLLAGNAGNSSIGAGGGALIGAGIGTAVGVAILLSKKGKKVDVRPGDELKIELAEDLRMPM